jgi:indolepyruvate ferredoxin oxidoreductase
MSRITDTLDHKYTAEHGWMYMTGIQALVRLPIQQRLRDEAAGWNTGAYISGYRGSPLGRYDMELYAASSTLKRHNIQFRPGLNEDLAATALWGSQYVGSFAGATVDGVFGIWYGKGPGVDRSGDALRHANLAGTSARGGVLALAGDDHGAKSSTVANFSDQIFIAVGMPLLYPSSTQELLDFGLHGIAMSRHSGCWVGMKVVTDVVEGGGSVHIGAMPPPTLPVAADSAQPASLHVRAPDMPLPQEERLYRHKLPAALEYARVNGLNQIVQNPPDARVGVISAGKSWQDLRQAMKALGLDPSSESPVAMRLLKIGMIWPLDPAIVRQFAAGLTTLIVIEEKRPVLEEQVRSILYDAPDNPTIIGKHLSGSAFGADRGDIAFPLSGELSPPLIARVLAQVLRGALPDCGLAQPLTPSVSGVSGPVRLPGFCSGCPHNRSTKVVAGSRALAGIGCHTMAMLMNPQQTTTVSQMGAEGVMWLGQQAFTREKHVFANIGDGTFSHSGFLAVRQAVAARVPITYKILYNGFVAMTGGQSVETAQSPAQILHGLAAEGVQKMALVTDDVAKYRDVGLPTGVLVHPRTSMDTVQKEFRDYSGVSAILYDQPCATERRRLRKRGQWSDPPKRTFINAAVCEGCGDCGKVSNCMSIEPLETPLGRKRRINQDSCNKDFSCVEGFCPSFVTVHGGSLRRGTPLDVAVADDAPALPPEPVWTTQSRAFNVLICGIGGTGVVTVGQTLAVAAHLSGNYSSNLDVTGLAQKYGAVHSHVRFATSPELLDATRIAAGEADLLIGCDLLVAAGDESLSKLRANQALAVVNNHLVPTTEFARNPDWHLSPALLAERLHTALDQRALTFDATRLAVALLGDAVAANMLMLGAAWQWGRVPLPLACIERAIELNGVAVAMNLRAFAWGRRAAHDPVAVERLVSKAQSKEQPVVWSAQSTADVVAYRSEQLIAHSGQDLAQRYRRLVQRVQAAERQLGLDEELSRTVAHHYHRLLAVKDEWEVARLYADPAFRASLEREFEGDYTLHFHFGVWPFARRDPGSGAVRKSELGPWAWHALRLMAALRKLRGTWIDPFRGSAERVLDRRWREHFEQDIDTILARLNSGNLAAAVQLASVSKNVRGYGHVREANAVTAEATRSALLSAWNAALTGTATSA